MSLEKLLVSSSLSLETNGHDLRGIGDVGLSVNAARFRNKLHDVSGRMFFVLAKDFDHCPDITTAQTVFWKINQQCYEIVFFDYSLCHWFGQSSKLAASSSFTSRV